MKARPFTRSERLRGFHAVMKDHFDLVLGWNSQGVSAVVCKHCGARYCRKTINALWHAKRKHGINTTQIYLDYNGSDEYEELVREHNDLVAEIKAGQAQRAAQ